MRHRGKTSSRLSLRAVRKSLRLEQLEVRQMLTGDLVSAMVSSGWFGNYAAANQPHHASTPSIAASGTPIASGTPAASNASGQLDWIVQFNTASLSGMNNAADAAHLLPQNGVQFQILEGLGAVGEVLVRSYSATAVQVAAALQSDSQIAWFELDSLKQSNAAPSDAQYSQLWALSNTGQNSGTAGSDIHATQAWSITTGSKNVVVAVIDSGVDYTHSDLAANIWNNPNTGRDGFNGDLHGYNFADNNGDPMDNNGHGTHVAGTIGAVGNNGVGVTGVNWNVTIMPLKFLDANGGGYTSDAIRAINYATMQRTQYGVNVRVINASWSSTDSDIGLNSAIKAAGDAGILFVAAAGNSASNNDLKPQYPANSGLVNVVSVAASDSNDRLASLAITGPTRSAWLRRASVSTARCQAASMVTYPARAWPRPRSPAWRPWPGRPTPMPRWRKSATPCCKVSTSFPRWLERSSAVEG